MLRRIGLSRGIKWREKRRKLHATVGSLLETILRFFLFDVFHAIYQPCKQPTICGDFAVVGAGPEHLFAAGVD